MFAFNRANLEPDLAVWRGKELRMAHLDKLLAEEKPPNDVLKLIVIKNNRVGARLLRLYGRTWESCSWQPVWQAAGAWQTRG